MLPVLGDVVPWHTHSQGHRIQPTSWTKIAALPQNRWLSAFVQAQAAALHFVLSMLVLILLHCLSLSTLASTKTGNKLLGYLLVVVNPHLTVDKGFKEYPILPWERTLRTSEKTVPVPGYHTMVTNSPVIIPCHLPSNEVTSLPHSCMLLCLW